MNPEPSSMSRAARWLTFGSVVAILFSIAISHILLALALVALLLSGEPMRLPRIKLALGLFLLGTIIALAVSGHPMEGLPQIRKIYVFGVLLVVFSCLRDIKLIRWLFLTWAGFASISGLRGIVQFVQKMQQARALHRDDYAYYVGERITGFMSHWNTFSAQEMYALIMLGAFLFFAPAIGKRVWIWIVCGVFMSAAVLLAETRAVWVGTAVAALYLCWFWKKWVVAAVPLLIVVAFLVSPPVIKERLTSFKNPKTIDSNEFRHVTRVTGIAMIKAHPIFGLGPEGVKYHFDEYVPASVPRPLPEGWYGHLHNIYLQYAAERGIPTMLMMMWFLAWILYDFWRGLRALPPGRNYKRFLLHGGIAVVLATLAEGLAENNLGDTEVLTMFLTVVGCGYLALEKDVVTE